MELHWFGAQSFGANLLIIRFFSSIQVPPDDLRLFQRSFIHNCVCSDESERFYLKP